MAEPTGATTEVQNIATNLRSQRARIAQIVSNPNATASQQSAAAHTAAQLSQIIDRLAAETDRQDRQ